MKNLTESTFMIHLKGFVCILLNYIHTDFSVDAEFEIYFT